MKGNVNPPGAVALSVFEEELMVGQCFLDEMVHFKSYLSIRHVYVGGLAAKMLRMAHSAHSLVECLADGAAVRECFRKVNADFPPPLQRVR